MPYGLPRKIRIAFLLQAALASLAVVLGGYLVSMAIKQSLIRNVLEDEASHYWQLYDASPAQPPPNTRNLRGYLVQTGRSNLVLPRHMRELAPGFHELASDNELVLVDQKPEGRLYLVFLRSQAERLAFWFGIVPVLLVLLAVYALSWLTYRMSKRLVSPINWLARRIATWDPRHPEADDLAPERLPADLQGETRQLAAALHSLAVRVGDHIARERNFTRDASHELRTPLTVIRVASDMAIADPELPPRMERSLRRIQRAGRDMEAVIDAFLILAREAEVAPQSETFDAAELAAEEVESARELLGDKPVTVDLASSAHLQLHAPPRVLRVVLSNLLRNACAYTDSGSVSVEVGSDRIVVRDTGIGMDEQARARAFEPFFRAEPSRPQGTGLGLSIVRRLCDRFGWRIELESTPGVGTSVAIIFA
ncbi:MAG TPA: two-component sensor histidine kinase [Xanthomonadaceae bacterium]|nr:two-component sensor histidine kinase [Xanthomonadaceae bacterium]